MFGVLICAYAVSPGRGSEPGMGWNFVRVIDGLGHSNILITATKWKDSIEEKKYLIPNTRVVYIRRFRFRLLERILPQSYYLTYALWQLQVFLTVLLCGLHKKINIIHHLNMAGYREPGFLWLLNKPFVIGPIGGLDQFPTGSLGLVSQKIWFQAKVKNILNLVQRLFHIRIRLIALKANRAFIFGSDSNRFLAHKIWRLTNAYKIQEVFSHKSLEFRALSSSKKFKICWIGLHEYRKNLLLLLHALENLTFDYSLVVIGDGPMLEYHRQIAINKLDYTKVRFTGKISREATLKELRESSVFVQTSLYDLTSTVVVEAISEGVPVIACNHMGFSDIVDDSVGSLIEIGNFEDMSLELGGVLTYYFENEDERDERAKNCPKRSAELSHETKSMQLLEIYNSLLT
jgi:glycosyltransferase involved in cell wall biosynthesis